MIMNSLVNRTSKKMAAAPAGGLALVLLLACP